MTTKTKTNNNDNIIITTLTTNTSTLEIIRILMLFEFRKIEILSNSLTYSLSLFKNISFQINIMLTTVISRLSC